MKDLKATYQIIRTESACGQMGGNYWRWLGWSDDSKSAHPGRWTANTRPGPIVREGTTTTTLRKLSAVEFMDALTTGMLADLDNLDSEGCVPGDRKPEDVVADVIGLSGEQIE